MRYAIAGTVIVIALVVAHKWLPGGRRRFVDIAPGMIVTLVLWLAGGILFGRYLAEFATNYVTMYAGLASAMIALVFLYCDRHDLRLWRRAQCRDHRRSARASAAEEAARRAAAERARAQRADVPEDDAAAGVREEEAMKIASARSPPLAGEWREAAAVAGRSCPPSAPPPQAGMPLRPRCLHRKPAIDRDRGTGDEIRRGAGEKHRDAGEILPLAPAAGRRAAEHALVQPRHLAPRALLSSVLIQPGRIAFTWMLSFAQAVAQERPNCTMPPLLAA